MVEVIPVESINPAPAAPHHNSVQAFRTRKTRGNGSRNSTNYHVSKSLCKRICSVIRNNVGWTVLIFIVILAAIISVIIGVLSKLGN